MARKDRGRSIRKGIHGNRAKRKERIVDRRRGELVQDSVQKMKREIIGFMNTLKDNYIVIEDRIDCARSIIFKLQIINPATKDEIFEKEIEVKFIIWTDSQDPYPDKIYSKYAQFVFRPEPEEVFKSKVLSYLEGVQVGLLLEYLFGLAQEELKNEGVIIRFYKTGSYIDRAGADYVMTILNNGRDLDIKYQVKNSEEELMKHKERHPNIPGIYWHLPRGRDLIKRNWRIDIQGIKGKLIFLIEGYIS